ncbi:hypothetical protein ACFWSF_39650 [Streptomyces sp. NPDC058611]|uniref:hypothetical protein n=1 Tax=unclassified Streptomyces TaxID=2593676 RepID=UPI00365F17E8
MLPTYTGSPFPFRTHEGGRFSQHLDRLFHLADLAAQSHQLLALGRGQRARRPLPAVGLVLVDPVSQPSGLTPMSRATSVTVLPDEY